MRQIFLSIQHIWKLIILLFLIAVTFSYAMFQGGFVSWFLFYSFVPFALYALFLAAYSTRKFQVSREFSRFEYSAGETLKVKIHLTRTNAFPLFYLVAEDLLSEQLRGNQNAKMLLFPGFKKRFTFEYEIPQLPRGEHIFQSVRLKLGDPLGLIEREVDFDLTDRFIVYPQIEELVYLPHENQFDQGMTASKERVQRDTTMAIGLREYQPGDKFSWINWKASAKRNDLMTKEFEQRQSHDICLLMDCVPSAEFETVVSFTASLIKGILRKGAQVGLLTLSKDRQLFPVRSGEDHQQSLFYHLAKIKAESQVPLDRVLGGESFLGNQTVSFMLVTSQLTKPIIEKASFFSVKKGAVTIYLVKNQGESLNPLEISLKSSANARGVRVVLVHAGHFSEVFSEVSR
ncbi:Uncharacterized conserved protein (some members contain a von Willebrand factor type A (vWA) domain) [Mycobacteroides abscessus subsp. abscessus]|nr:Uncharacterized conserved protein (some members contain a von Willebrand factor type A (vWA) domain) [Mycobacteroides abscessus subsp. abscessus]